MKKLCVFLMCLLLLGTFSLQAQMLRITGVVTGSNDGLPIPGVTVLLKGTTTGVTTDIDGKYTLTVPTNAAILSFSFVGMKTMDVEISGRTIINVVLEQETKEIEEVIVTGYTTRVKNSITGSTVQVKSEALENISATSVDQALQGKVAGLVISATSGTPGSTQDIRIRGRGSLTASNDPLFVLDGVPIVNSNVTGASWMSSLSPLSALNNNDIESITVLKDASATSAYGARGSNGVIVITTKKGKIGKTNFSFSGFYGFQNKASKGLEMLTPKQKEELFAESLYNSYGVDEGFTEDEAVDWGLANGLGDFLSDWISRGRPNVDWEEAARYENAPIQNYMLSASGGNEESSFYASLGFNKTQNIVLVSDYRRISGTFNFTKKVTSKLKLSTNNSVSSVLQSGLLPEQSAYFANPIACKYFMNPWVVPRLENGEPNLNTGNNYSWLYLKDHDKRYNDLLRGSTNSFLELEVIKNLKYKTLIAIDYSLTNYFNYQNRHYGDGVDYNGQVEGSDNKNFNLVTQNSLSYNLNYKDHNISLLALVEFQKNNNKYIYGYGESFVTDGLIQINSASTNYGADGTFNDWMNLSYLGMVNYNYLGKYIADFTYRREGSSLFPKDLRFGNFWSVGGAWNIGQESFISGISFISNLKLRTSYGVSGNSGIDINSFQSNLAFNANYAGEGASYPPATTGFGNPNLTWEKNHNFDVGIDLGVLKNKINGSISYFNKTTTDLLQAVPLSRTQGFTSYNKNIGSVVNKGIEAIINIEIIKSKDFNFNLSFNFATVKNEVTKLAKNGLGDNIVIDLNGGRIDVGHPIYEWYARKWAGVNPDNGAPQWYINGKNDEDGITENYNAAQRAFQGKSPLPKYTGGSSIHLDYKGIYLDASIYFAGGNQIRDDWSFYYFHNGSYTTDWYNGAAELMKRWQKPGDITDVPRLLSDPTGDNASRYSTRFLYDGDYIRLRDVTFGYNIPKSIFTKVGFDGNMVIYVKGSNLLTWVKDDRLEWDPEVRSTGLVGMTNPVLKSITFGLNINF